MSKTKRYVGVYGLFRLKDEVLVVRKSRGPYLGCLDLPGGAPEHGEELHHALVREVREETGVVVERVSPLANFSFLVDYVDEQGETCSFYHVGLVYRIEEADHRSFSASIHQEDVAGALWLSVAELDSHKVTPFLSQSLEMTA